MVLPILRVEFVLDDRPQHRVDALSPKAKYVLVQFALRFGGQLCACAYEGLASQFGMTKPRMSAALKELAERGMLEAHPKPEGQGRPVVLYRLAPRVWECLREDPWAEMVAGDCHRPAIEQLLRGMQVEASSRRASTRLTSSALPKPLAIESRLLLCALLCYADRYGVARGLSVEDLQRLTGFGRDALGGRLRDLDDLELIRAYVPGVTSHFLFGKAKSVYYLNLQHPLYASLYPVAGIRVYGVPEWFGEAVAVLQDLSAGEKIRKIYLAELHKGGCSPEQVQKGVSGRLPRETVASIGKHAESGRILPALQARLEYYAAWLLSRYWSEVESEGFVCPEELAEIIRRDFVEVRQKQRSEVSGAAGVLVAYIYDHALSFALDVRSRLKRLSEPEQGPPTPYHECEYLILPHAHTGKRHGHDSWFRTVLVFPRSRTLSLGCLIDDPVRAQGQGLLQYNSESQIPLQMRRWWGLLIRPAPKAGPAT